MEKENVSKKSLVEALAHIQTELKVAKDKQATDKNGRKTYSYRSAEDILEKVKPLLNGLVLTITDDVVAIGDRIYIKATATITDGKDSISTTAFAKEGQAHFMSEPQFTGACSSYARKYALSGLLLLDDNREIDEVPPPKEETLQDLKIKLAKELEFLGIQKSQMVAFLQYAYVDTKTLSGIKAFLDDENRGEVVKGFLSSVEVAEE